MIARSSPVGLSELGISPGTYLASGGVRQPSKLRSGMEMAAAAACSLAIASVPVFSYQESYLFIPQFLAAVAIGFGVSDLLAVAQTSSGHGGLRWAGAHFRRVGPPMPGGLGQLSNHFEVCLLALVSHIVFRTPKQLLWLFVIYSSAGVVTLTLNWHELEGLRTSSAASGIGDSGERFAGTMQNACHTAGMYGATATLGALIVF